MYNSADILARLREGATPESIADEMANALNEAQDLLKEEETKALQKEKKEKVLDELAARIAADVNEYLEVAAEVELTDDERMTGAEVRKLADELSPMWDLLKDIKVTVTKTPHSKTVKVRSPEDVFAKFFKELGL